MREEGGRDGRQQVKRPRRDVGQARGGTFRRNNSASDNHEELCR